MKSTSQMRKSKLLLFLLIFLIGCSRYKPLVVYETIEKNICENNTITVFNETVKYVNVSEECPPYKCTNETVTINKTVFVNKSCRWKDVYVFELIRRIKFLESIQDESINLTLEYKLDECYDELSDCNETLEDLRDLLE